MRSDKVVWRHTMDYLSEDAVFDTLREDLYDIYAFDVTLPGIKDFHVMKVVSTQLLPLYFYDEHKPVYSRRVRSILYDRNLNEDEHPFM